MPMSRALKDSMRGEGKFDGVTKRVGISSSGGVKSGVKPKQYNFPKDTAAVGPHYPQDEPTPIGVVYPAGMK